MQEVYYLLRGSAFAAYLDLDVRLNVMALEAANDKLVLLVIELSLKFHQVTLCSPRSLLLAFVHGEGLGFLEQIVESFAKFGVTSGHFLSPVVLGIGRVAPR